jgi:hypothetical protein
MYSVSQQIDSYEKILGRAQKWIRRDKQMRANMFRSSRLVAMCVVVSLGSHISILDTGQFWFFYGSAARFPVKTSAPTVKRLSSGSVRITVSVHLPHEMYSFLIGDEAARQKFKLWNPYLGVAFDLHSVASTF